jgi:thiamine transport system substrate-binding protein
MKTIIIFLTTLFISFSIYAEKLTIYTYDSFVSEWGSGPIIEKIFEEKHNADVEFVAVDSAATLLNKVILEGDTSKADIVLGLDMNLFDLAEQSELFTTHNINDINNLINLPLKWESNKFVPYNFGYFSFVYNEANLATPPKSMDELINSTNAKIVIQDPRTSTPGLGLLTWMKALYGDKAGDEWKKLNKKIISVTKGWTDAYYNFFMAGEADMVLSYTTSPAAHIMFEERYDILATTFEEGNYITIEFAGILNNSQNKDLANKFLNFILSEEFQSVIPSTNIMYPVTNIKNLPEAFDKLDVPNFIQMDPKEINKNKEKWIDEWLNAS